MNFIEAINLLETNTAKAVRKSSWREDKYLFYDTSFTWLSVTLDEPNCMSLPYSAKSRDILANDWEIYEEKTKLHTFEGAVTALKNGATIFRKLTPDFKYSLDASVCFLVRFDKDEVLANDWIIMGDKV